MGRQVVVEVEQILTGYVVVDADDDDTNDTVAAWVKEESGDFPINWENGTITVTRKYTRDAACQDTKLRIAEYAWCDIHGSPMSKADPTVCYHAREVVRTRG